ncbi:MAG: winged helix-turn-helix transcriptional regulator [Clostridia bacterium]|nr:winged helix-turn-helix transcriptional regulator [Clostridia bacterium]
MKLKENGTHEANIPDEITLYELSDFFKIFADSTRLKILFAIDPVPLCVRDIAEALGMSEPLVSHHLRALRQARLISHKREGKHVIYSLKDEHVRDIIEKGLEHIEE